jgi:hypothetical protein
MDKEEIIFIEADNFTLPEDIKLAREEQKRLLELGRYPTCSLYTGYFPGENKETKEGSE